MKKSLLGVISIIAIISVYVFACGLSDGNGVNKALLLSKENYQLIKATDAKLPTYPNPIEAAEKAEQLSFYYSVAHLNDLHKWYSEIQYKNAQYEKYMHSNFASIHYSNYCGAALVPASTPCSIPSYICNRESQNTINAKNKSSSASGKYQFLDSTWGGYGGYIHACQAPESLQDARAQQVWDSTGGSAWKCC